MYPLVHKTKQECTLKFQHLQKWIETRGWKTKQFRCDNARGEYNNDIFFAELNERGIEYAPAPPYTQHKNGASERMIQTINAKARAMLIEANVPIKFWGEAVSTAVYIHRRTPQAGLGNRSPHEILTGKIPEYKHLRRFGCLVYLYLHEDQRDDGKWAPRITLGMMLGYVHNTTKLWRIWSLEGKRTVEVSNCTFHEEINAWKVDPSALPEDYVFPEEGLEEAMPVVESDDEEPEDAQVKSTEIGDMEEQGVTTASKQPLSFPVLQVILHWALRATTLYCTPTCYHYLLHTTYCHVQEAYVSIYSHRRDSSSGYPQHPICAHEERQPYP